MEKPTPIKPKVCVETTVNDQVVTDLEFHDQGVISPNVEPKTPNDLSEGSNGIQSGREFKEKDYGENPENIPTSSDEGYELVQE